MKFISIFFATCLFMPTSNAYSAWNWSGTLKSKVQTDNRYTRYVNHPQVLGEVWGSFEAFDNDSWRTSIDFVARESSKYGFQGGIYQLYAEKQLKKWDSTIKAGRFQRSDSLGFYSLDGASLLYQLPDRGLSFTVYGGRPTRQEDVRSVSGDWLYGVGMTSQQQLNWRNNILPIDIWLLRVGFQQFHNEHTSTRLTLANTISGEFNNDFLYAYELSFSSTLETESGVFEQVFMNFMLDITEESRVSFNYSLYELKGFFPTFKEKFYSQYYQGRQDLLSLSFDQQVSDTLSYHLGGKRAARQPEHDVGYGFDMGVKSSYVRDLVLTADFDMLEFGKSSSYNMYFSSQYSMSASSLLNLNLAYSWDTSSLYGQNRGAGTELKYRYKLYSDVFLDLAGSYIVNSRLNNEYLVGLQATWYFDNFQAKVSH